MRILVPGDLHCPADRDDYLPFLLKVAKKYKTEYNVFIGDQVDSEAISFHDKNPNLPTASTERDLAKKRIKRYLNKLGPSEFIIGNHDARYFRKALKNGIPEDYLKSYEEVYDTPGVEWKYETIHDGVMYQHGTGWGHINPALQACKMNMMSVVCGHSHTKASINTIQGPNGKTIWGMNVGCGINLEHPTFKYSVEHLKKAVISCGVVIDGHPYLELMNA